MQLNGILAHDSFVRIWCIVNVLCMYQSKFLVCENLLGNKPDSDSNLHTDVDNPLVIAEV